ncbi:von Willebrand factor type A domain protein [Posidoniimonas polymericola]|uniref:von Willebrand factor type A domain protein n=1 Tax=Posidoniimonas polymericola TaxID=2528002 RepID=A0A5C5YPS5_9BACT|nr:VWA domain-containing protein [Posidoniimonas polymericola]TWT76961.1 von Willebrand factor type A domain protein [Posidoniimonas polymericola]
MDQLRADSVFSNVEFAENPEPRVPCVLLLDTSTSMHGPKLDELNKGLQIYRQALLTDPLAAKRVEVAVVTFGGRVQTVVDFVTAEAFDPPTLNAIGGTPLGEAVSIALDMIEQRKDAYRENGVAYYRPWAFLITDGEPNDHWKPVISRIEAGEKAKSFSFFCVGVEGANMEVLTELSVRKPLWLQGLKFAELFTWLSNSQQSVSRSSPGEDVPLEDPTSGPTGWAAV